MEGFFLGGEGDGVSGASDTLGMPIACRPFCKSECEVKRALVHYRLLRCSPFRVWKWRALRVTILGLMPVSNVFFFFLFGVGVGVGASAACTWRRWRGKRRKSRFGDHSTDTYGFWTPLGNTLITSTTALAEPLQEKAHKKYFAETKKPATLCSCGSLGAS